MSAKSELIETCAKQLTAIGVTKVDEAKLDHIITSFGPGAFNKDSQLVALSDEDEVNTLMNSKFNEKMNVKIDAAAIEWLKEKFAGQNRRYRTNVYYMLMTR
jgi:hypothetical protein